MTEEGRTVIIAAVHMAKANKRLSDAYLDYLADTSTDSGPLDAAWQEHRDRHNDLVAALNHLAQTMPDERPSDVE